MAGIVIAGLAAISMVVYAQYLATNDFERNMRLVQLTQSVQQEISTAHLWFEEALGGDTYIVLEEDVHERVRGSRARVEAVLEGRVIPIANLRDMPRRQIRRWTGRETCGARSAGASRSPARAGPRTRISPGRD